MESKGARIYIYIYILGFEKAIPRTLRSRPFQHPQPHDEDFINSGSELCSKGVEVFFGMLISGIIQGKPSGDRPLSGCYPTVQTMKD